MKNILIDENIDVMDDAELGSVFVENFGCPDCDHEDPDCEEHNQTEIEEQVLAENPTKSMSFTEWNNTVGKDRRIKMYRGKAGLKEDDPIDESMLKEDVLRYVATKECCSINRVKNELLGRPLSENLDVDDIADKANVADADVLDADDVTNSQIWKALDRAYKTAQRCVKYKLNNVWPNIIFEGLPGVGKTAIVNQWAKANGIQLVEKTTSNLSPESLMGIPEYDKDTDRQRMVRTSELDALMEPNTVLFLDEYNRGRSDIRNTLLKVMCEHVIPDSSSPTGVKYLDGLLFCILAINPVENSTGTFELGNAEYGRTRLIQIEPDPRKLYNYLSKQYNKFIAEAEGEGDTQEAMEWRGRLGIAKALLSDPNFKFDSAADIGWASEQDRWNKKYLEPRDLERLLTTCDGTKDDFLDQWDEETNNLKKDMAEYALEDYEDAADQAMAALLNYKEEVKEDPNSKKARTAIRRKRGN